MPVKKQQPQQQDQEEDVLSLEDIAYTLGDAKATGNGFDCLCPVPAHNDKDPSLSLSVGNDGKLLCCCHGGCAYEDIVAAMKELGLWKEIAYDYRYQNGELVFQAVRYPIKRFSQRQPDGNGGWKNNLKGVQRGLPYRLPEVLAAVSAGGTIFIVEGEKDVGNLRKIGLVGTCNAGGAGKWREEHSKWMNDAQVVLLPDKDDVGQKHMQSVATSLNGIAASIKIIDLPGLALKEDVSDWLAKGGTREKLEELAAKAPLWEVGETPPADFGWPDPEPLVGKIKREPYPFDALPDTVRKAVEEVQGFTKAPISMVATSALSVMSLATQAHVDIKRAEKLSGPTGLYFLGLAPSGERKTKCDELFSTPIRDYEAKKAEEAKPELKEYRAKLQSWEAKCNGIKDRIRQLTKKCQSTLEAEKEMIALGDAPERPRFPKLLRLDDTPENLAWILASEWPSGGVLSSEAGIVLGAHGMGSDSIMRHLALLNILWDGGTVPIGRKTSKSFTVRGARFTMGLQITEPTLRSFFDKNGPLARGIGFMARFLISWPESTQGYRPFTDPPENWPALEVFNQQITTILNEKVVLDGEGALTPTMLSLSADAKAAWIEFHDAIEAELRAGGDLYDVRDVASKAADNAVRLAALFHVFQHGPEGAVGLDAFESASRIVAWHLNESRRFFGEIALPAELVNAARLDTWLIDYCRREKTHLVGKNHTRQHGPLRDGVALQAALRELDDLDRVRLLKEGKRLTLQVNPALVSGGKP